MDQGLHMAQKLHLKALSAPDAEGPCATPLPLSRADWSPMAALSVSPLAPPKDCHLRLPLVSWDRCLAPAVHNIRPEPAILAGGTQAKASPQVSALICSSAHCG